MTSLSKDNIKIGDKLKRKDTYSFVWEVLEIKERGAVLGLDPKIYGNPHKHLADWGIEIELID